MNRPIRVLQLTTALRGSAFFNNLYSYFDPEQVVSVFATFTEAGEFSAQLEERGATVYKLGVTKNGPTVEWLELLKAYRPLCKIIEDEEIDIIHPHLLFPTILGVSVAKIKKTKSVFSRHHSDSSHVLASPIKRKFYLTLEHILNRSADHIIAPSKTVREILTAKENVSPDKVSVIPYGQVFERFSAVTPDEVMRKRAELGMDAQFSMLCVSRLFPTKGQDHLLDAVAPMFLGGLNAKLFLMGDGPFRDTLENKVKDLGISDFVVFLGYREDLLPIIAASDLVVHPSLEDALSQSLIESLMMTKPIVATDISGAGDTLGDGKYGKLVKPADVKDLRHGIVEVMESLDVAQEKANKGRDFLLKYMAAEKVSKEYEDVYYSLMSDH